MVLAIALNKDRSINHGKASIDSTFIRMASFSSHESPDVLILHDVIGRVVDNEPRVKS